MPEKRKDSKGRVLKDGESQRANGTYDYRYTDIHKKRRCIYAKSLTELRKKEEELWRDLADGIDYAAGEMTVADLVDRYMNLKRGLKPNSLRSYNTAVKRIHADPFGQKAIKTVKLSDAKGWFVFLHDSGFKQNTIGILQSVVRPAFEMAQECRRWQCTWKTICVACRESLRRRTANLFRALHLMCCDTPSAPMFSRPGWM